ncbi:MAG: FolB domain-containing protein, partial [Gammaproteobacteria bacterium]|nr:FolB domain-containing protein [Gammaproteobacteria bacterium]
MSEARINISNLRLRTYIGFNPEEKTKQQDVIVNAEMRYRADPAFASDDEADALNYKSITK